VKTVDDPMAKPRRVLIIDDNVGIAENDVAELDNRPREAAVDATRHVFHVCFPQVAP
jgi:hypothetical protein